jgi:DNA adenine methylase
VKQDDVLVKWTGSKRIQAPHILKFFPAEIKTYYEPFIGGGSMLFVLMSSEIKTERIECSDLNFSLIDLWQLIKDDPDELLRFYVDRWPFEKEPYYALREEFNADKDPRKFFCLLRTCRNGLVRYNRAGRFTSAFHQRRKGVNPDRLEPVLYDWSRKLNERNVTFRARDYQGVQSEPGDFVYLDPPYASTEDFYYGMIDFEVFWEWLDQQGGDYAISLNGQKGEDDCTIDVPDRFYTQHILIDNGTNKFCQLNGNHVWAKDSLYV